MKKSPKNIIVNIIFVFVMLFIGINNIKALENKEVDKDNFISNVVVSDDAYHNLGSTIDDNATHGRRVHSIEVLRGGGGAFTDDSSEEGSEGDTSTGAGGGKLECDVLLSEDTKAFLNKILGYVKVFAPLLVIVLGMLDFIKATVSQDNDALKKAGSKFFKRLAAAALLFIFPALIQFLLDVIKIDGVTYCKM